MSELVVIVGKTIVCLALAYWVYHDCQKHNISHANLWIIVTFVFPPTALAYYLYRMTAGSKKTMTLKQKYDFELRRQTERERRSVAVERAKMEQLKAEEQVKNKLTLEELEAIKAERTAQKEKRLTELKEERRLQQEELAKKMRLSKKATEKMKMLE